MPTDPTPAVEALREQYASLSLPLGATREAAKHERETGLYFFDRLAALTPVQPVTETTDPTPAVEALRAVLDAHCRCGKVSPEELLAALTPVQPVTETTDLRAAALALTACEAQRGNSERCVIHNAHWSMEFDRCDRAALDAATSDTGSGS